MAAEQSKTEGLVEHEVRVAASPDSVFEYFTDPAKMVMWIGTEATLDPRPGGVCRINPSGQAAMLGEFVEVDRPRRIVFTWGWETAQFKTPPQSTLVEVSLTPDGEDRSWSHPSCLLSLAPAGGACGRDPQMGRAASLLIAFPAPAHPGRKTSVADTYISVK